MGNEVNYLIVCVFILLGSKIHKVVIVGHLCHLDLLLKYFLNLTPGYKLQAF